MDSFGFKNNDLAQAVTSIQPRKLSRQIDTDAVDAVAVDAGFQSRESKGYILRRKSPPEPSQPFSMRLPISVVEQFAAFAEKERLSYPKALARLLELNRSR